MIQLKTQRAEYWGHEFALLESDIERISNHLLEVERPQTIDQLASLIIRHRITEERNKIERQLSGRTLYRPKNSYNTGDEIVFPALQFTSGTIKGIRQGYNPEYGTFKVLEVMLNGRLRQFVSELSTEHRLNDEDSNAISALITVDVDTLCQQFAPLIIPKLEQTLKAHTEFLRLNRRWFIKALLADINIGHLHLAEAILEMNNGGPLATEEIIPYLDLDPSIDPSVQTFSLDYGLLRDDRFDEVAPKHKIAWFLRRMEPDDVQNAAPRLKYTHISYDRSLLNTALVNLEREIDDEWSDFPDALTAGTEVTFSLIYPHRATGTIPLTSQIRPLFPLGNSPRHSIEIRDEATGEPISAWVAQEHRYIFGLADWYEQNKVVVGAYLHLKPGPDDTILLSLDRRQPKREWVRLATVAENQIAFELNSRPVACQYDDLLIMDTDLEAAIEALRRRAETQQRPLASLLAEVFPQLEAISQPVHAKTLYSAVNMLRRVPPGPIFAELIRRPAFKAVGDNYWRFDAQQWSEK